MSMQDVIVQVVGIGVKGVRCSNVPMRTLGVSVSCYSN